jgi:hypothetical protein
LSTGACPGDNPALAASGIKRRQQRARMRSRTREDGRVVKALPGCLLSGSEVLRRLLALAAAAAAAAMAHAVGGMHPGAVYHI